MAERMTAADLWRALGMTYGVLALLLAVGIAVGYPIAAVGAWFVWMFATRDIWIPPHVRLVYSRRWTKVLLWPYSMGDEASCVRIVRSITRFNFFGGLLAILVDVTVMHR